MTTLYETLAGGDATVRRSPNSTVIPPRGDDIDARAVIERLRQHGLTVEIERGEKLGQGGMGVVHVATQIALGRKVAVKELLPHRADAHDAEALVSEAVLTGSLEHPNIVPVHDLGLDAAGRPLVVMKRIEGVSWSTLLRDPDALAAHAPGRLPLHAHLQVLIQVCNALRFAHSRGVIHRDLKPDNVMIGPFGEVVLVDWGIATVPGPCVDLAGTPVYMAPEMLGEGGVLTPQTDVYLVGAVLCELLTGTPPHEGASPTEIIAAVRKSSPSLPDGAPSELAALVRACMQQEPSKRPASVLEVRQALEDFLSHAGALELAAQSEVRLHELQALLTSSAPDARRVFDLFSECRFGFQQALRAWSANVRAERGLEAAVEAMITFELRGGSARHAESLLRELKRPSEALVAAVGRAVANEVAKDDELARLKEVERAYDPQAGGRQRLLLALAVGIAWIIVPLVGAQLLVPGYEGLQSAPPALLSAAAVAFFGRRLTAGRTVLNLQLLRILVFCMTAQGAGLIAIHFLFGDLGPRVVSLEASYWCLVAGILAVGVIPEAWISFLGYGSSVLISALWPEWRYEGVAFSNFVLCINVAYAWKWRPRGTT